MTHICFLDVELSTCGSESLSHEKGEADYEFRVYRNLLILTILLYAWYFKELTEVIEPKKVGKQRFSNIQEKIVTLLHILKLRPSVQWYSIVMIIHVLYTSM